MKFSTSALMAVALVASPLARAYECGLNKVTSIKGAKDAFGFCSGNPTITTYDDDGNAVGQVDLSIPGTHLPLNNRFDNTEFNFGAGFTGTIPPGEFEGCSTAGFATGSEDDIYDKRLENDVRIEHVLTLDSFDNTGCTMKRLCTTVYTWAQGFANGGNMLTSMTVEGNPFTLSDGDKQDLGGNGEVTTELDERCIEQDKLDGAGLMDGVQIHIDLVLNEASGEIGSTDNWAIDYSQVDVYFECPCSETAPDPHFKTFSGDWFDFHGGCDLVLIDVPDYANQAGLAVNIRTTVRYAYSFIETIAIKVGEDILQVSGWGDYMINGISNVDMSEATLNGRAVTREVKSDKQFKFVVNLENGHHFTIKVYKDMISTSFDLPQEHDVRGILGDRSGTKLARDGITVIEDANEFGQEWQVQDTDHQLFVTVREPQFPAQCIMPDPVEREQRRLSATVSTEAAEAACSHVQDEHVRDMCIFDVMSVDDLSLAAGAY